MDMIQTQGKQNKKVTTLLTNEMTQALDVLIDKREKCGVRKENKYIFANTELGHIMTWQTMRKVASQANLENPTWITCNALRKYISTVVQVNKIIGKIVCL